jgi:hypothetical protein
VKRNWKKIALTLSMAAMLVGCGGPNKYTVRGTAIAPGTDAKIVADVKKESSMTQLQITAENLAPPERLAPDGKMFVLWTMGPKRKWHRVGALNYREGDRKASIEGVSVPVTQFELQVTVESTPDPESPSSNVVISQQVN